MNQPANHETTGSGLAPTENRQSSAAERDEQAGDPPVNQEHAIWELTVSPGANGEPDAFYFEGYSNKLSDTDPDEDGDDTCAEPIGWFCMELTTIDEVLQQAEELGFSTDDVMTALEGS